MVQAREVRARVRAQAAEELSAREEAVVGVAAALETRAKAAERLADAERAAGGALQAAAKTLSVPELARLLGHDVSDLRRLARAAAATGDPAAPSETEQVPDSGQDAAPGPGSAADAVGSS